MKLRLFSVLIFIVALYVLNMPAGAAKPLLKEARLRPMATGLNTTLPSMAPTADQGHANSAPISAPYASNVSADFPDQDFSDDEISDTEIPVSEVPVLPGLPVPAAEESLPIAPVPTDSTPQSSGDQDEDVLLPALPGTNDLPGLPETDMPNSALTAGAEESPFVFESEDSQVAKPTSEAHSDEAHSDEARSGIVKSTEVKADVKASNIPQSVNFQNRPVPAAAPVVTGSSVAGSDSKSYWEQERLKDTQTNTYLQDQARKRTAERRARIAAGRAAGISSARPYTSSNMFYYPDPNDNFYSPKMNINYNNQ